MKRTVFHVVPAAKNEAARWAIKLNGIVVSYWHLQAEAVKDARARAKDERPSQLIVHGRSGRILDEFTYAKDPRRYWG